MLLVGQKIAGKRITWKGDIATFRGGKQTAFRFKCECKAVFEVVQTVVTRALKGGATLRCVECRKADRLKNNCARGVEPPPVTHAEKLPPELRVSDATKRMLAKLKPDHRARTVAAFRQHAAACLQAGIALESADRLWAEAAEVAVKFSEDDHWTRENISSGLQLRCYRQYTSPSHDAFV